MNHLSLFELTRKIRNALDKNLDPSYWVVAEIGELRINQKGHCYLELVEKAGEELVAKVRGTIWAYTYSNLSTWFQSMTGSELTSGMKILANVQVQYHELYGLSFNIRDIDPNYTLGEKERQKQEVINRLIADGIFNLNKSLPLPAVPQNIAVISSPTAAGYEDFVNQLARNPLRYAIHYKLFKAVMQGDQAEASIINALLSIHDTIENYDLVVIIRGGGSQADLDCFDRYDLACHVAQFPLPVITGIGHERDETITDMVAHTKLKTPTAVSEFLLSAFLSFENHLFDVTKKVARAGTYILQLEDKSLQTKMLRLRDGLSVYLNSSFNQLSQINERLKYRTDSLMKTKESQLGLLEKSLHLLDPLQILKRGYTISTINGKVLNKVRNISKGSEMITRGYNVLLTSKVEKHQYEQKEV